MAAEYSEGTVNDTLRYLHGLFDIKKYMHENKLIKDKSEIPNFGDYQELQVKVKQILDRSSFNKVNLSSVFAFMRPKGDVVMNE